MSGKMADEDDKELLKELELDLSSKKKKKKRKPKITLDSVSADVATLAASGGSGDPTQGETPAPPVATGDGSGLVTDGVSTATPPVAMTTDLIDEEDIMVHLAGKRKKRTKGPKPIEIAAVPAVVAAEPQTELYFDLPKKKKRKRLKVTFEGFDKAIIIIEEDEVDLGGEEGMEREGRDDHAMVPVDNSPWAGSNRDYSYEELLERVFNIMREKNPSMVGGQKKKVVMKPPQVVRVGARKTSFVNFTEICKLLHRQPRHLLAFLLAELGTSGSVDGNNQLIIKGKFQQKQIETVLRRYIKEYVTCHTCRSSETMLLKETRVFFLQCETCGSRCSVQSIKSGFQAVLSGHRAQLRSKQT